MRVVLAGLMLAIALFLGYAATRGARLHAANTVAAEKHRTYSARFPSAENRVSEGATGSTAKRPAWIGPTSGRRLHRLVWSSGACVKRRRIVILHFARFCSTGEAPWFRKPEKRSLRRGGVAPAQQSVGAQGDRI